MTHTHCLFSNSCGPDPGGQSYRSLEGVLTLVAKIVKNQARDSTNSEKYNFWIHQKFVAFPGSMEGADSARSGSEPSLQKPCGLTRLSLPLLSICLSVRTRQSSPAARESSA